MSLRIADIGALGRKAAAAALNAQAELGRERTADFAPKEDSALARSFVVDEAVAANLTARISSDLPYAVYQHEALYLEHPRGGQAKFMESAVVGGNSRAVLERAAAAAARRAFG